jgi:hypothetical protein
MVDKVDRIEVILGKPFPASILESPPDRIEVFIKGLSQRLFLKARRQTVMHSLHAGHAIIEECQL